MDSDKNETQDRIRAWMRQQARLFYSISNIEENDISVGELLRLAVKLISNSWQYPQKAPVLIEYNGEKFTSESFWESSNFIHVKGLVKDEKPFVIKVMYPEDQSFLEEEKSLFDAITTNLISKIERVYSRRELEEEQELLDKAYKLARIGTWEYDMINEVLHWSDITKEVHGFDHDYVPDVESTVQLFKEGFHRETFAEVVRQALENKKPFDVELKIISGKGDERWIRATGEPEYQDGVCTRFYGISQNVTNRKQAEEDLQLNERRFKALVQDGSDMIAIIDDKANYKYVSPTSLSVLGIPAKNLVGQNALEFIHEKDRERVFEDLVDLSYKERVTIQPFRFKDVNDNWRWVETTLTNLIDDPAVGGYVANSRDITEQYNRQEKMEGSLKEKETLLAEIHHRIKNNLSVLTSLLQLQAADENNREVLDRLFDSVARIHTMASIHEQLYQSKNYSKLELADRIKLLALNIQKTFQSETAVDIEFQCESVQLNVNQALPCSLILNEVITNVFKHAFNGREKGVITIGLKKTGQGQVHLSIKDNGVGLPDDFDMKECNSLGMTLIGSLSEQLMAEYHFESSNGGTTFSLKFEPL